MTSEEAREHLDGWRLTLVDAPILALPTDHPRPARVSFQGAMVPVAIDPAAAQALAAVARGEGTTTFVALLAVWSALLGRLSGQDDLVVGASVANRDRRETQGVVGFFANMVAVRLDVRPRTDTTAPSLRALLRRARAAATEAFARQEVPFETVVAALRPERDASRNPFFQVAITLEEGGDLGARALPTPSSKFDLSLDLRRFADAVGDRLEGVLEYATALFDEASADAIAHRFARLLAASAAEPDRPIDDFDLVSKQERALLAAWNKPAATSASDSVASDSVARNRVASDRDLTTLFAAQVVRSPDAVAVEELGSANTDVEGRRLTYAALASSVRRLAHHLRSLGVGPEVPVALGLAPSVERVMAMLAVAEAGGYYLLIDGMVDDDARSARWQERIEQVGVRVVVGQGALVDLTRDADAIGAASDAPLSAVVSSQHLLYAAIENDGATVGIPHGAFTPLVRDTGPGWLASETVLRGATAGPDVAALEVWGPLVSGGRVVILPAPRQASTPPASAALTAPSPARLGDAIRNAGITALWLSDGLFQAMVDHQLDDLLRLRQVLTGGGGSRQIGSRQTVPRDPVRRFIESAKGHVTLTHVFGDGGAPFATAHVMAGPRRDQGMVPIGRPLGGLRSHVLDHRLRPVPIGVIGTLYLTGDRLARGYLSRPSHTAARFVPAPSGLGEPPGTRLYGTGARVRWRRRQDTGVLERIAPADRQWVRNGYRTDLADIEHAVMAHAAVRSAVVVPVAGDGTSRLVAYVVLAETSGRPVRDRPSDDALRAFVGERLPRFLVPDVFVGLARLPLTMNGAIDYDALPTPGVHGGDEDLSSDRPRGATEALLAGLWAELLRREHVGRHDNFFDLGGHSLRATRLVSRLRQTFEVEVPLSLPFEAPDLAAMAERIDQLHQQGVPAFEVPIEPVDTSPVAVSFGQERLWFLDRLDPGAAVYNIPLAIDLRGDLEPARLAQALTCLVARHSALRSQFVTLDGQPHQELLPPFAVELPVHELTADDDTLAIIESRLATRAFDLVAAPPWHAELLRLDANAHRLVWVFHHIIVDGWSVDLLLGELADAYQALGRGSGWAPRPQRPTQTTDHAVWQRRWLVDAEQTRQLDYWRHALEGVAVLDLPTDRPRPALQSHQGAHLERRLDATLWAGIEGLAGRLGATPFMVALAAFRVLLYRTAGSRRFAIGTPVAGRRRPELESVVGFCVNTLALATTVEPAASFADLVAAERQVALGAYGHQDLPFERLVEVIEPERDLSRSSIFQVMFVWRDLPRPIEAGGLRWSLTEIDNGTSKADLTLGVGLIEGEPHLVLEYARALFDSATAEALLGRYVALLRHAIVAPDTPVARLPMMSDGEASQVARFALGEVVEIADASLVQLVEARAARAADAIAIESFDGRWQITRAALVDQAHAQARALRSLGVGLESRVGVFLERAPDQAIAFLGILAAGGCYVPMELDFPADRLAFMIEDTGLEVILTRAAYVDRLPARHAARAVMLDELIAIEDGVGPEDRMVPLPVPTPANLAYVMYTSGSTGHPKGVAVSHRNIVQVACHAGLDFTGDTMLQVSPTSFDGSTLEIWGALLVGARLVVAPPEQPSADSLVQVIAARGVTMLGLTTGLFHQLVEHRLDTLGAECRVMTGGDILSAELARRWADDHRTGTLFNCYGPTESTVHVVRHPMDETADVGHQTPLGRPICNATIRLLDDALQPVPPGVVGELYLGGPCLSRGYLGRPGLTAERFVPDPLATTAGERLYRSGDRARWRRDGRLLFLGRVDDQLKLRGFRIEPGEVRAALEREPAVAAAVVLARPDATGEKRLLAWVELVPNITLGPAALAKAMTAALAEELPAFMLPSAIMVLDALPLTAHGKVNRQALPDPDPAAMSDGGGAPEGAIEEVLANIYADVLGHEHIARHDDFFALGGHSLRATQMATRISRDLGVEIPLRAIFELPRLTDLAAAIDAARGTSANDAVLATPVATTPRPPQLPLSFAQERLWFLSKLDPKSVAYHIPGFVHLRGSLDVAALGHALNVIVARHETLRTTFHETDTGPIQRVAAPSPLPVPLVDMTSADVDDPPATALWHHARAEARRPFDLASDAPLRAVLYRLADDDHRLLLVFHHIASDWWSQKIFFDELQTAYGAAVEDRQPVLPPLTLQYADYALWQRSALADEVLAHQLAHGRDRLAGVLPLDLPDDPNASSGPRDAGGVVDFAIGLDTTQALEDYARRAGATPFIVLLALWQATLYRWTGQGDFAVGSPIAGRRVSEVEGLVGFFLNTLVLRTALDDDPSFAEHVRRVRATTLDAHDHQDLPFERLVDALAPCRDLITTPLFQVQFAFQNELPEAELPGLEARFEAFDMGVTKYPLSLGMGRGPDGLAGTLTYASARFERSTAERLTATFGRLAESAVATPDQRVSALPFVDPAEARQVARWSVAETHAAVTLPVHRLLEQHAAATPERPALIADGGVTVLDYQTVLARARRLAHRLHKAGVRPEQRVAIALQRGGDFVIAALGILGAGGAVLPLDIEHPPARRRRLLDTAAVVAVITAAGVDNDLPAAASVIEIDARDASIAPEAPSPADAWPTLESAPEPAPENLAMVIFTSGSTGTPKGVLVEHRQLSDYALGISRRLALPPDWTFGLVSTLAADLGLTSVWGAFASGGAVHVVDSATALDPEAFADLATAQPFDVLKIVPSHLDALLMSSRPEAVLPRRLLVLGGEAAGGDLLRRVRALAPACRIVNHYGPTEATIGALSHELPADVEPATGAAAIGRPLPNGRVEVLDGTGQRVGVGVPGDLLLGGPGTTRGYLGRPAATAERFVPDPYATVPGARLYRTGDRARWQPAGLLSFLGRRDHQVKIRGHRVELGEVEAALGALPKVARAVVLITGDISSDNPHLVAFVVPADPADRADPAQPAQLRRALADQLPAAMVPSRLLVVDTLPLDPNGKVDRGALRARADALFAMDDPRAADDAIHDAGAVGTGREPNPAHTLSASLTQRLLAVWRRLLGNDTVRAHDNFFELGGHSLLLVRLQRAMRQELAIEVAVVDLFTHPTVARLVRFLESVDEQPSARRPHLANRDASNRDADGRQEGKDAVAIVGMAGRFPGAADVDAFWRNLRDGVESIRHYTRDEQRAAGLDPALLDHPNLVAAGGALDEVDRFDAGLFGFRPREAAITDPQQRMFLECAWEALEDAAIDPRQFAGRIGVFAGCGRNNYFLHHVFHNPVLGDQVYSLEARMGNDKDFLPSRTAYKLGLEGPAVAVQTACSTSMVALHLARRSLLDGECEAVLAGGVRIHFPCATGYLYQAGGVVSPDGHCRAFDAAADGGVPSDGCGTVVLMRLDDALERGAPIRAILRGSAINNDGAAKVGYTAPGVKGQTRVIRDALAAAGIAPSDLDVIEAHGTGTHLGDPIEIAALREVFGDTASGDTASDKGVRTEPCWIGSVKTNIGHLDTAAGITGVIKSVLALEHGAVPPTLHFERANPALELDRGPFRIVDRLTPWPWRDGRPRRVGVSSFGIGGTNAHAVLEEAPPAAVVAAAGALEPNPVPRLLVLSAHGKAALDRTTERLATFLEGTPGVELADVAHTLMLGRRHLDQRRVLVAHGTADAAAGLRDPARHLGSRRPADGAPETIFLLPGQGTQHPGMAARLYQIEARFRAEIDLACAIVRPMIGLDLRTVLYPEIDDCPQAAERLALTAITQPALFVVETALARLWQSWDIEPAALLGHSIGELVAAHLAGVWDLETALAVVAERGRLMQAQPPGAMASVPLDASEVEARIADDAALRDVVAVAVVNAPNVTVVAGPDDAIAAFCAQLADDGVETRRLRVSHAFHSPMMAPAAAAFERFLDTVPMQVPRIPIVSNVSGTWLSPEDATSAAYWAHQIRRPVRFAEGLSTLLATPGRLYLEVGPGNALGGLVRRRVAGADAPAILSSLPRASDRGVARGGVDDALVVRETLGRLWLAGVEPDFAAVDDDRARCFVRLPTYAFERQRYWIEPVTVSAGASMGGGVIAGDDQPLSASDGGRPPHLPNDYVAPADDTEAKLVEVWSDLFGVQRIGVVDGYFDLGGDSLLATQLVARIHEALGYDVTVAQLMEANDVRTLAQRCRRTATETPDDLDHLVRDLAALSTEELEQLLADDGEGA